MKQYIADAFTDRIFHGNQAAICLPETWLSDEMMMNITKENNFSETAFAVKEGDKHHLRWFTPGGEIDLCGHATLACAYVLFRFVMPDQERVVFTTMSGDLTVVKKGELLEMEFPSYDLKPVKVTDEMALALGARPKEAYMARDLLCVYDDENIVRNMKTDMEKVKIRYAVQDTVISFPTGQKRQGKIPLRHTRLLQEAAHCTAGKRETGSSWQEKLFSTAQRN